MRDVYKTLDLLIQNYHDAEHERQRVKFDLDAFRYVNDLKGEDAFKRSQYLRYYFSNTKEDRYNHNG